MVCSGFNPLFFQTYLRTVKFELDLIVFSENGNRTRLYTVEYKLILNELNVGLLIKIN